MKMSYHIRVGGYRHAVCDLVDDPQDYPNALMITRISVPKEYRGNGHARKLMEMVLRDADAEGVTLVLGPVPSGGLTLHQLKQWYKRLGFQHGQHGIMVREPKRG